MRKAMMIATALIAVLALSVGALAYPVVVGSHASSLFHTGTPATVTHPKTGDDNSTGNQTNDNETGDSQGNQTGDQGNETGDNDANETNDNENAPVPPAPEANETENETDMSNVTVDHNVTVTQVDNTTYVNGTIMVVQNGTTLVDFTFQIVAPENGTANVTINGTQVVGSETVSIHGFAVFSSWDHSVEAFGVATASANGSLLWERPFGFDTSGSYLH